MEASASYVPGGGAPTMVKDTGNGYGKGKHGDMFPTPQWRDLWAAILFYSHFAVFLGVATFALLRAPSVPPDDAINVGQVSVPAVLTNLAIAILSGILLTALCINFMYSAPEGVLHGCFIANILITVAIAIGGFVKGQIMLGVIMSIFSVLGVLFYLLFRRRIPFSAVLLRTVIDGLRAYPAMLNVTAGSVIVTLVYASFWAAAAGSLAWIYQGNTDESTNTLAIVLFIYSAFSLFWTSQVITNTVQTTIAGVYATFYFFYGTGQAIVAPTAGALRRALTYSFGSICFGSLIVATLQTIRFCIRLFSDDNSLAGCIADCILGFIEGLVEYFNYYAYTQVAIYGKPYVQAARDTWRLVKSRGVDAIVNDNIIGTCLGIASLAMGILVFAITYLVGARGFGEKSEIALGTAVACALITLIIANVAFEIIGAGTTTTFVCLAEDPQALQRARPELYNLIMQKYSMITI